MAHRKSAPTFADELNPASFERLLNRGKRSFTGCTVSLSSFRFSSAKTCVSAESAIDAGTQRTRGD
jgi:hypothetical protein